MHKPAMTVAELDQFLAKEFPQFYHPDSGVAIEDAWYHGCRIRQAYRETFVRPGGTISGPTMMALADFAMYVAVLASIGPVPLAVTTNFNINFLRRPAQRDLIAETKLMKLGKRLAVGEVAICSEGHEDPVAHVTDLFHPRTGVALRCLNTTHLTDYIRTIFFPSRGLTENRPNG